MENIQLETSEHPLTNVLIATNDHMIKWWETSWWVYSWNTPPPFLKEGNTESLFTTPALIWFQFNEENRDGWSYISFLCWSVIFFCFLLNAARILLMGINSIQKDKLKKNILSSYFSPFQPHEISLTSIWVRVPTISVWWEIRKERKKKKARKIQTKQRITEQKGSKERKNFEF